MIGNILHFWRKLCIRRPQILQNTFLECNFVMVKKGKREILSEWTLVLISLIPNMAVQSISCFISVIFLLHDILIFILTFLKTLKFSRSVKVFLIISVSVWLYVREELSSSFWVLPKMLKYAVFFVFFRRKLYYFVKLNNNLYFVHQKS